MAERIGIRFTPTPAGLAAFLLPLGLLYPGLKNTDAVSLVVAAGLPSVVVLSLFFILFSFRRVVLAAGTAGSCSLALPLRCSVGVPVFISVDPPRPKFLPGLRLTVVWKFQFGPFRHSAVALLPVRGAGNARLCLNRRGGWQVTTVFRATDPFGFFRLDIRCGSIRRIIVPPVVRALTGAEIPGRPDAKTATAPRLREDAEVRMERRSYVPGDDPRRLDWRHFARSGEMLIRVGEDGLPFLGRLWIRVLSPPERLMAPGERVRRLDVALEAAADLARQFAAEGGDVRLMLPGEFSWNPIGDDMEERLACSLPDNRAAGTSPPQGERLWIVSYPSFRTFEILGAEQSRGRRITLGFPSEKRMAANPWSWKRFLFTGVSSSGSTPLHRILQAFTEADPQSAIGGSDVRRI